MSLVQQMIHQYLLFRNNLLQRSPKVPSTKFKECEISAVSMYSALNIDKCVNVVHL